MCVSTFLNSRRHISWFMFCNHVCWKWSHGKYHWPYLLSESVQTVWLRCSPVSCLLSFRILFSLLCNWLPANQLIKYHSGDSEFQWVLCDYSVDSCQSSSSDNRQVLHCSAEATSWCFCMYCLLTQQKMG